METIRICINKNILKEYLEKREQEVIDMLMTLFDDEQILKAYVKDIKKEAAEEAAKEAAKKTAKETAAKMIQKGKLSLEEIAEYVPSLSMEELKELEMKVLQLA